MRRSHPGGCLVPEKVSGFPFGKKKDGVKPLFSRVVMASVRKGGVRNQTLM